MAKKDFDDFVEKIKEKERRAKELGSRSRAAGLVARIERRVLEKAQKENEK